jgi:hypothetical protein
VITLVASFTFVRVVVVRDLLLARWAGEVEERLGVAFFAVKNAVDEAGDCVEG